LSRNKGIWGAIVVVIAVAILVLTFAVFGQAKTSDTMTAESIGTIDLTQLHEKYPAFVDALALGKAYDAELNSFAAAQRQAMATYNAELETKKDGEEIGKTEAEQKTIDAKYEKLAQDMATQINTAIQNKKTELQNKLNAELQKADDKMRATIAEVAAAKNLKLVLVKNAVYFGGVDVTSDVITKAQAPKK
jgi:Skp family chaperone for outer membrane proteins